MKKVVVALLLATLFLTGCEDKKIEEKDYSEYKFVNVAWERDAEHDSESLIFRADGSFSYSCGCGNPVNDSDMCDSYTYNDETKEIHFECFDTTEEMITTIKVINVTDEILELDFNNEIRKFEKSND